MGSSYQPCPECGLYTADWIEHLSLQAHMDYFRCRDCGEVWAVEKRGAGKAVHAPAKQQPDYSDRI